MCALFHILAEPLASDNLWSAFVFLAALAILTSLRAVGGHIAGRRRRERRSVVK